MLWMTRFHTIMPYGMPVYYLEVSVILYRYFSTYYHHHRYCFEVSSVFPIIAPIFMNIEDIIKTITIVHAYPIPGIIFRDITTLLEDPEAFKATVDLMIERISHLAFKEALKRKKKITLVDKANVLDTSRLWREIVQEISNKYPDVKVSELFVYNAAMKNSNNPKDFEVIRTENMFGDIITDEASVITGSLGMLPSASVGDKVSLFEPIHGSYPQAAGKNIANHMAMILSAAMMLNLAFDMKKEADIIQNSVRDALDSNIVTEDISSKKSLSTSEVGDWISKRIDVLF